jgi:hypothetical protein
MGRNLLLISQSLFFGSDENVVELNSDGIHPCEYAKTTELSMSGEFYGM